MTTLHHNELFFKRLGGVALRLVSATGLMTSLLALRLRPQTQGEELLKLCAVYYFAVSAFVSFCVRDRRLIGIAGMLLNLFFAILISILARTPSEVSALTMAVCVIALLWMLFASGLRRPFITRRLFAHSSQGS
jgi:hypothetical protein